MLVQNNSNNQSFNGRVAIVGDLSAEPCRRIRNISTELKNIIKDKPFDLFIRENHKEYNLSFIAQKPYHFGKKNKPISEYMVSKKIGEPNTEKDIERYYLAAAANSIENFASSAEGRNNSMMAKFKYFLSSAGNILKNLFRK